MSDNKIRDGSPESPPLPSERGEAGDLKRVPVDELGKSGQARPTSKEAKPKDDVDEAVDESFPASDPPSH